MNKSIRNAVLGCAAGTLAITSVITAQNVQTTRQNPQHASTATNIVRKCAGIRAGELVFINGSTRDQTLLEDVAVEVRKLGGHPLISVSSDRLTRKMFKEIPAELDGETPKFAHALADTIDAEITIEAAEAPDLLADIDPQRRLRQAQAYQGVYKKMLGRGVVQVHLGNGLYPVPSRARQYGLSVEQLSDIFWKGVNTNYDTLQKRGALVQSRVAAGNKLRITAANGTDLTMDIASRPVHVSDGVVSDEDRYARGPACQVWLPAGEVYLAPVPGTARGTFIADDFFYEGQAVKGLTLSFQDGKLVTMTAKGDLGPLERAYEAAPAGRDVFAVVDIGINPDVTVPAQSRLVTWMAEGTISVGFGGNAWAGGENDISFDVFAHLPGATLTIDGRALVENGRLITR